MFPVFLYSDSPPQSLVMQDVTDFLTDLGLSVEFRGDFLSYLSLGAEEMAELESSLSRARVFNIETPVDFFETPPPSEPFEKELYDGFWSRDYSRDFFLESIPANSRKTAFTRL